MVIPMREVMLNSVGLLLLSFFELGVSTAQADENDDIKVLLELECKMAGAWVQRDTQTLEQILADDYTLAGAGDALIGKGEYLAGIVNPEFGTTSAIVDDLRIRLYGDAAVVTGRGYIQERRSVITGWRSNFRR
jgi:Domain of unknown function (DUF4440)